LIRQVYEVDPLLCSQCGGRRKVTAVIECPAVVRQIRSAELATKPRAPPHSGLRELIYEPALDDLPWPEPA
jgi:hypothetical protein